MCVICDKTTKFNNSRGYSKTCNPKCADVMRNKNLFAECGVKNRFQQKDINHYKTKEDVDNLISRINQIENQNSEFSEFQDKSKFISKKNIEKLNEVGIYFLGVSEGYQVFYIPSSAKGNEVAFKRYRDILSNCAGREKGESVRFCTLKQSVFNGYLENDSSLFILYNLSDPNSPYQLSFESKQFKDKNNKNLF